RRMTGPGSGRGSAMLWTRRARGPWSLAAFIDDNLRGRVAAVEEDRLARHEVRARRGEIYGEWPDLLGPPDAASRDVAGQALVDGGDGERLVGHVGLEPARRDRVDLHVVPRPLHAERARERDDAALPRAVDRVARQADLAEHRGDVDHLAGLLRDQVGRGGPTAVEDSRQVHVEHEAPVLRRHLDQGRDLRHARVVDDDVEAAELADR